MGTETIDFISKTGWIEESAGRRKFKISMEADMREYEKKMLCSGECPYTLPMHFISEGISLNAYYDFTGYVPLKECIKRKLQLYASGRENQKVTSDVLYILSGILECVKGIENYLILPERISVHTDVVFVDLDNDRIKLAFYPNENRELSLQSRITGLVHELSGLLHSDEADQCLKKIDDFILMKNPGLDGMISFLGSMQREAGYIYGNLKDFRKIEEQESRPANQDQIDKRRKKYDFHLKTAVIQIIPAVGLLAVFLSGRLSMINFAGVAIITAAIDLMILRKRYT
jgi:hypothetical protein